MFKKGESGNPRGPAKGVKKSKYRELKKDMLWAYGKLGGKKALKKWAGQNKETQEVFYKELLKLVPREIGLDIPEKNSIKFEMIINDGKDADAGDKD